MNEKNIRKIGNLLLNAQIINDYEIEDLGTTTKWITVKFLLNGDNIQTINVTFNKEHGYIMHVSYEESIDLLEED